MIISVADPMGSEWEIFLELFRGVYIIREPGILLLGNQRLHSGKHVQDFSRW